MRKTAWYRMLALLFGFALIAVACGSDDATDAGGSTDDAAAEEEAAEPEEDDGETGGAASEDEAADAVEEAAADDGAEVEASPDTLEGLRALWDEERQGIVDTLNGGEYGLGEDGILVGPDGFSLDTNACPGDWSNTEGIDEGAIEIAHTTANSGTLAAYGNIAAGMGVYFDLLNEDGGIDGLPIEFIVKDDQYVSDLTIEFVAELLQSDKPFVINTLGSPNTFAVYNTLNEACVPQAMVMTGHQAWGDPVNHPWTTGLQMSYATESLLWGSWIEDNFDEPVTVGALVMDNDFGLAYEQGFADFAASSDLIEDVEFVRHDPASATLTNEITTIANADPDVFISMTAGNPCLLAIQEAGRAGLTETADALFTPSVCGGIASFVAPAGDVAEGWFIFNGGVKDITDSQWDNDPWITYVRESLDAAGLDIGISTYGEGFGQRAWAFEQVLRIAADLDGGLNRTNVILAQRGLTSMTNPFLIDGIEFGMSGNADSYFVEGSQISKFNAADQSWVQQGGVIDLAGKSPNCAWVSGEGC